MEGIPRGIYDPEAEFYWPKSKPICRIIMPYEFHPLKKKEAASITNDEMFDIRHLMSPYVVLYQHFDRYWSIEHEEFVVQKSDNRIFYRQTSPMLPTMGESEKLAIILKTKVYETQQVDFLITRFTPPWDDEYHEYGPNRWDSWGKGIQGHVRLLSCISPYFHVVTKDDWTHCLDYLQVTLKTIRVFKL